MVCCLEEASAALVMCACVCAASTSSSQTVAVSGPFRPVSSSAPAVSGGAFATERSPPVCEGELCGVSLYFLPS